MLSVTSYPSKVKQFVVKDSWTPWNRFACYNSPVRSKHPYLQGKTTIKDRQYSDNLCATYRLKKNTRQHIDDARVSKICSVKNDEYDFFSSSNRMGLRIRQIKLSRVDIHHDNLFTSHFKKRSTMVPVSISRQKVSTSTHRKLSL